MNLRLRVPVSVSLPAVLSALCLLINAPRAQAQTSHTFLFVAGGDTREVFVLDPQRSGAIVSRLRFTDENGSNITARPLGITYFFDCLYVSFDDGMLYGWVFRHPFTQLDYGFKVNLGRVARRLDGVPLSVWGGLVYITGEANAIYFLSPDGATANGCITFSADARLIQMQRPAVAEAANYSPAGINLWLPTLFPDFVSYDDGSNRVFHPYLHSPSGSGLRTYLVMSQNPQAFSLIYDHPAPADRSSLYRESPAAMAGEASDSIAKLTSAFTFINGYGARSPALEHLVYVRQAGAINILREIKAYAPQSPGAGQPHNVPGCPWTPQGNVQGQVSPFWSSILNLEWFSCTGNPPITLNTSTKRLFTATYNGGVTPRAPHFIYLDRAEAYVFPIWNPSGRFSRSLRLSTGDTLVDGFAGWKQINGNNSEIRLEISGPVPAELDPGISFASSLLLWPWGTVLSHDQHTSALWLNGMHFQPLRQFALPAAIAGPEDIDVSEVPLSGPLLSGRVYIDLTRPQGALKALPGFYSGELPIRQAKLTLQSGGFAFDTYTDDDGRYAFSVPTAGQQYQLKLTLIDREELVRVFDVERDAVDEAWVETDRFVANAGETVDLRIRIRANNNVDYTPAFDRSNTLEQRFGHLAFVYHNIQFGLSVADSLQVRHDERVEGYTATMGSFAHSCANHEIYAPPNRAPANAPARPFADFHEYGHHTMCTSPIAGVEDEPAIGDAGNHQGINNSTSSDAWLEGFATYFAAIVQEGGGDPTPHELDSLAGVLNLRPPLNHRLDDPRTAGWNMSNGALGEELAIAGLLWNLDQRIGRNALWSILHANTPDLETFKAFYDAVKAYETNHPSQFADLSCNFPTGVTISGADCLFIERGFYHDADGDGLYDSGERVGITRWNRPAATERGEVPAVEGSTLRLHVVDGKTGAALNEARFVVHLEYDPPWHSENVTYEVAPSAAPPYLMNINVPGVPSRAHIIARREGYQDSEPLTIESDFYHDAINPFRPGGVNPILMEHTFVLGEAVADVAVNQTASANPAVVGAPLTYTVSVQNHGPSPATDVKLTNTLPANVALSFVLPSQGTYSEAGGIVICDLGEVPSGGSATVSVYVTATTVGMATNGVTAFSAVNDTNLVNNASQLVVRVLPAPELRIRYFDAQLILSWPVAPAGFVLESTPDVSPFATWATVPEEPQVLNSENVVTLNVSNGAKFFRLRY